MKPNHPTAGSAGQTCCQSGIRPRLALGAAVLACLLGGVSSGWSAPLSEQQILAGAEQRIEQHRMALATVHVQDARGRPVTNARVEVEQRRHAFLFGCNIFQWDKLPDPKLQQAYRERFAELLNYATLPFYWNSYERRRGQPRHQETERVARWCREHGIATKGHPLAWNMGDPPWLPDDLDEIFRLQLARIKDCVSRFAGLIDRWDVVNEATHFDRPDFVNRRAPKLSATWKKVGRIEFARACFREARQANPKATLLINDYRTDPAYEKVIEQLVDEQGRRLYDVIGIQSHMHGGTWSTTKIWDVCERFSRFGVPLHFTETTILSGERAWQKQGPWPSTPEGEAWQAKEAVRFYTVLFSHPAVEAITWWDFCDYYAWKRAPAGFLRKDMSPKPVYEALKGLIKGKWWTRATLRSDAEGQAKFRGFLGDYVVRVTDGGRSVERTFTLRKDQPKVWRITLE